MNYTNLDLVILKNLLYNKKYALDFANECDVKLFSTDVWNFAKLILNYIKAYKEIPTLKVIEDQLSKTSNQKLFEYIKNIWVKIDEISIDEKEFKFYVDKLKNRYAETQIAQFQDFLKNSSDTTKTLHEMQRISNDIKSLGKNKLYEKKSLKKLIGEFKEEFNAKLKDPTFDRGVLTGYSALDLATGGLQDGEMLLIGGESSSGKSMLLMNMAIQIWMQDNNVNMTENFNSGHNVLYFSLEMPIKPCRNRVFARLAQIPSKLLRNPLSKEGKLKINSEQKQNLKTALNFINNYPYHFEIIDMPRGCSVEQIELIFEEAKNEFDPKIVVVDYLGIMDDESEQDDWLKLGTIAGKLHELTRVHNIICLSAVQLNRMKKSKDSEETVGMHRIGRSSLIMHHSNIGIQIETRQNEKKYPDMKYHLIKNRDGELVSGRLIKNLSCGTLLDDPTLNDDSDNEFINIDDISDKIEQFDL